MPYLALYNRARNKPTRVEVMFVGRQSALEDLAALRDEWTVVLLDVISWLGGFDPDRSLSVRTALVYEGHLDPSVEAEGYFDFLIPFARLLEGT